MSFSLPLPSEIKNKEKYKEPIYHGKWKYKKTIMCFVADKFPFSNSVFGLGLEGTLVKSKAKFPRIPEDWKFIYRKKTVLDKLRKLYHEYNASVVFFEDVINVSKGIISQKDVKERFEQIIKEINIPVIAIFATHNNCFRKPHVNMWNLLEGIYISSGKCEKPSKKNSVYLGHLAGRLRTPKIQSKKDKSDRDRAFAYNINVQFWLPEQYFIGEKYRKIPDWEWDQKILTPNEKKIIMKKSQQSKTNDSVTVNLFKKLINIQNKYQNDYFVIILMGPPSSGKSVLSRYLAGKWMYYFPDSYGIEIFEKNSPEYKTKRVTFRKEVQNSIELATSVIIDDTHPSNKSRQIWIDMVKNLEFDDDQKPIIVIIEMDISVTVCRILNQVRIETTFNPQVKYGKNIHEEPITNHYYKKYNKFYEPVNEISKNVIVKHILYPVVLKDRKEFWYRYSS